MASSHDFLRDLDDQQTFDEASQRIETSDCHNLAVEFGPSQAWCGLNRSLDNVHQLMRQRKNLGLDSEARVSDPGDCKALSIVSKAGTFALPTTSCRNTSNPFEYRIDSAQRPKAQPGILFPEHLRGRVAFLYC